jgi:hypothetical protein
VAAVTRVPAKEEGDSRTGARNLPTPWDADKNGISVFVGWKGAERRYLLVPSTFSKTWRKYNSWSRDRKRLGDSNTDSTHLFKRKEALEKILIRCWDKIRSWDPEFLDIFVDSSLSFVKSGFGQCPIAHFEDARKCGPDEKGTCCFGRIGDVFALGFFNRGGCSAPD